MVAEGRDPKSLYFQPIAIAADSEFFASGLTTFSKGASNRLPAIPDFAGSLFDERLQFARRIGEVCNHADSRFDDWELEAGSDAVGSVLLDKVPRIESEIA